MRARNLKPGFFKNELLAELHPLTRIFFEGLWCMADREGRLECRPKKMKAGILPYDRADPEKMLDDLAAKDFIAIYIVGEEKYVQVLAFREHQNPHPREAASDIPALEQGQAKALPSREKALPSPASSLHSESPSPLPALKGKRVPSKTQEPCPKPASDEAVRLTSLLLGLISNNNPKAKLKTPADLERWAADLDRLHRLDNQAWADIETVLRWSQDDDFWSKNVLSGAALRRQWDKLSAKVFGGTNGPGTARSSPGHPGPQAGGVRSKYDDIDVLRVNLDEDDAPTT